MVCHNQLRDAHCRGRSRGLCCTGSKYKKIASEDGRLPRSGRINVEKKAREAGSSARGWGRRERRRARACERGFTETFLRTPWAWCSKKPPERGREISHPLHASVIWHMGLKRQVRYEPSPVCTCTLVYKRVRMLSNPSSLSWIHDARSRRFFHPTHFHKIKGLQILRTILTNLPSVSKIHSEEQLMKLLITKILWWKATNWPSVNKILVGRQLIYLQLPKFLVKSNHWKYLRTFDQFIFTQS